MVIKCPTLENPSTDFAEIWLQFHRGKGCPSPILVMFHCPVAEKLESSQSPHTSAKAMLFARWQHHLRFCSGFPYAPLKAMVTKISKWSRIQDSCRITPKIESLVACAIPDTPSKFQKDPSITFWVILLTHRQTDKQTKTCKNITSLVEVIKWTKQSQNTRLLITMSRWPKNCMKYEHHTGRYGGSMWHYSVKSLLQCKRFCLLPHTSA